MISCDNRVKKELMKMYMIYINYIMQGMSEIFYICKSCTKNYYLDKQKNVFFVCQKRRKFHIKYFLYYSTCHDMTVIR